MTHTFDNALLADLHARELVNQMTAPEALAAHLDQSRTLYCGFDPTAESLHIGSLVPLLALRRFQLAGHKPLALVGGATGLIGDPSFKSAERRLNTPDVVAGWAARLKTQIGRFLDFDGPHGAELVNNLDWMAGMGVLDFLRDVGKHFSVNAMIQKESVRQRIEREGEGISYTEFTYMLLQSYDFAELNRRYGCTLQIGGSDQWGNITGGIDLARRLNQAQVYGLTLPLVTKADGSKFGKTESGTVWLDAAKTSPYAFYQFWINTADADVYRFLRYFTFLPVDEIAGIEAADAAATGRRQAQTILAREVTALVHGKDGMQAAERISQALFAGEASTLSADDYAQLAQDGLPTTVVDPAAQAGKPWTGLLVECGLATSGKQVQDALKQGALHVNGHPLPPDSNMKLQETLQPGNALFGRYFLVRLGKKKYQLLVLA
ncbi:MAG: tyrosine--tRNA ligase [Gammaproteobacteria bacterium]|nr:MAG: tyrosine--tRNA ligase [Gammaproteobacteria bacterium]